MGLFLLKNSTAIIMGIISILISIILVVTFLSTAFHIIKTQLEHLTYVISSYIQSIFLYYGNICIGIADSNLSLDNKKETIKSFVNNSPYIKAISIVDSTGTIVYSYPDTTVIDKNISFQSHIKHLLKTHKPTVSSPIYTVQGYEAIAIHYPQFINGKFVGSIAVLIPLEHISDILQKTIKNKRTVAIIVNEENTPIITIPPESRNFLYMYSNKEYNTKLIIKDLLFYKSEKIHLPNGPVMFLNIYVKLYESTFLKIVTIISFFIFIIPISVFFFIIGNDKYYWNIFNKQKEVLRENNLLKGLENSTLYYQEESPINKNILFNDLKLVALYHVTYNNWTLPTNITYTEDIENIYIKGTLFSPEKLHINFNNIILKDILNSNEEVEKFEFSHPSTLWHEDNELYHRIFYTTVYIEKGTLYIVNKNKDKKYGILFLWAKNYKERIKEWQEKMIVERIKKM